ncbi:MAG: transposase family protein [Prevotellaceae bacterium]|jgi:hypothetical protein|nr:transposase family protein [Prevotellaceae bacterium]
MEISNDIVTVSAKDLMNCGIQQSYSYIIAGDYTHIPPHYQSLIREHLCGGLEPREYLAQQAAKVREAAMRSLLGSIADKVEIRQSEVDYFVGKGYSSADAARAARAAGWLRLYRSKNCKDNKTAFRTEVFKQCLNEQAKGWVRFPQRINSEVTLSDKARDYERVGIDVLYNKMLGNINRLLIKGVSAAKIIELASDRVKFSEVDITMMYNDWVVKQGKSELKELTVSAIVHYLNLPSVKKIWYYNRHGRLAADNEIQQLIERRQPSRPDILWTIDGTPSQLYYISEKYDINKGKIVRELRSDLYIYFIIDACTGAIIGYSIAYSETAQMVVQALRNCIDTYGFMPEQIQFDNSSANITSIANGLMQNMARVAFPCQPYKGRSKYVEMFIGHFQERVLRYQENFKGGNITAKSLNSRANPELIKELCADKGAALPTADECIQQIIDGINEWNSRGVERDKYGRWRGESKIIRYQTASLSERRKINEIDKSRMFRVELLKKGGAKRFYTYKTTGISITIDKVTRTYSVLDGDGIGDFAFAHDNLGKEFTVRINMDNPDTIGLYNKAGNYVADAIRKEQFASNITDLNEGEMSRIIKFQQKQEQWGYGYAQSELARQKEILRQYEEQRATGTDGMVMSLDNLQKGIAAQGFEFQTKDDYNRSQSVAEDNANGLTGMDLLKKHFNIN